MGSIRLRSLLVQLHVAQNGPLSGTLILEYTISKVTCRYYDELTGRMEDRKSSSEGKYLLYSPPVLILRPEV